MNQPQIFSGSKKKYATRKLHWERVSAFLAGSKKIIRPGSLAKYDMKNCTQFWPRAHSLVKMYETHHARTTVVWQVLVVVDVAAGSCCCCGAGACGGPTVKKTGGGVGGRAQLEGGWGGGRSASPPMHSLQGMHCRC